MNAISCCPVNGQTVQSVCHSMFGFGHSYVRYLICDGRCRLFIFSPCLLWIFWIWRCETPNPRVVNRRHIFGDPIFSSAHVVKTTFSKEGLIFSGRLPGRRFSRPEGPYLR